MRLRLRPGLTVSPGCQYTEDNTVVSASVDVNVIKDPPKNCLSILRLKGIRSLFTKFKDEKKQFISKRNRSMETVHHLSTFPFPTSIPYPDPNGNLEAINSALVETLEKTRVDISLATARGKLSHHLHHLLKFEILLTDTISAVNSSRICREEMFSKYAHQLTITAGLELLLSTKQLEIDQMRSLSANSAHDLKSPLHVMIVGTAHLRPQYLTT